MPYNQLHESKLYQDQVCPLKTWLNNFTHIPDLIPSYPGVWFQKLHPMPAFHSIPSKRNT